MTTSRRLDIEFDSAGITLAGTLHLPPGAGPHPLVLMLQGSGDADREGNGYFPPIRDAFLERGIAAFSFDKPGCGESGGDWRDYALYDRADQAEAALDLLSARSDVDQNRLGVWGQSQGGWLVQIIAGRRPGLAFAVANSGPSIGVVEQDLYGCEHTLRAAGRSAAEIARALEYVGALHSAARAGTDYDTVVAEITEPARGQPWAEYMEMGAEADWGFGCRIVTEDYRPLESLARVRCPFLAIYGGRDVLVPAWRGAEETGRALADAATTDGTVVVFPDGDHRIRDESGEFSPGYLDLLASWTAKRAGTA